MTKLVSDVDNDLQLIGWISLHKDKAMINHVVEQFQKQHKDNPNSVYVDDPVTAQTIHVATECAFHKLTGLKWVPFMKGRRSDGHIDFMIPKPYKQPIDIKGCASFNRGLLVTVETTHATKRTCYVHGIFEDWYVMFKGYAWTAELKKKTPRDYGLGKDSYKIPDDELHPMGTLINIIRSTQTPSEIEAVKKGLRL